MIDRKILGENIRHARERADLTQQELAQKVGKANTTISSYENGTRPVSIDDLVVLATTLNEDIRTLLGISEHADLLNQINQLSEPFQDALEGILLTMVTLDQNATAYLTDLLSKGEELSIQRPPKLDGEIDLQVEFTTIACRHDLELATYKLYMNLQRQKSPKGAK